MAKLEAKTISAINKCCKYLGAQLLYILTNLHEVFILCQEQKSSVPFESITFRAFGNLSQCFWTLNLMEGKNLQNVTIVSHFRDTLQ